MSVREAPISRGLVDDALPWLRAVLGILFVAYSANSTIFISANDLRYFIADQQTIGYFADRYWYAALLALILFVGEVATGERYKNAYIVFLIPDAIYTTRGMAYGLHMGFRVLAMDATTKQVSAPAEAGALIGAWLIAVIAGYLVAKYGEVLLFGKRRRITRSATKKED